MQYGQASHLPIAVRSAGVVMVNDGQVLLVQEKKLSAAGLWHIPAGFVEAHESLEQAACREAKEETSLDVTLLSYINTYVGILERGDYITRHVWLAQPASDVAPQPELTDEIMACQYFSLDAINDLYEAQQLRMYHTKLMVEEGLALHTSLMRRK
ncbi:MAG: NUDIX domain-containing protein [Deinococcota bacterium]